MWTLDEALEFIRQVECVAPEAGCHVALTGGVLYKLGPRKDLDLLFYRIRQVEKVDTDVLWRALAKVGIARITDADTWCVKAKYGAKNIDCFFPEAPSGLYPPSDDDGEDIAF